MSQQEEFKWEPFILDFLRHCQRLGNRKACPFCGSDKISDCSVAPIDPMAVWCITCNDCDANGPVVRSNHVEHATEAWNWRDSFPANLSCVLRGLIDPWLSQEYDSLEIWDATCCPFCSSNQITTILIGGIWTVWCVNCECEGPWGLDGFETRESALCQWNKRACVTG